MCPKYIESAEPKRGIEKDILIIKRLAKDDQYGAMGPLDELSRRRTLDQIIQAANRSDDCFDFDDQFHEKSPFKLGNRRMLFFSVGFAATALIVFALWFWAKISVPPPHPITVSKAAGEIVNDSETSPLVLTANGNVRFGEKDVKSGDALPWDTLIYSHKGTAVLRPGKGILIALSESSEMSLPRMADGSIEANLTRGEMWVSVDPAQRKVPFSVVTSSGAVKVKGTVFSVSEGGLSTRVEVLRGKVSILAISGEQKDLTAGHYATIKGTTVKKLDSSDVQQKWNKLVTLSLVKDNKAEQKVQPVAVISNLEKQIEHSFQSDSSLTDNGHGFSESASDATPRNPNQFAGVSSPVKQQISHDSLWEKIRFFRKARNWTKTAETYELIIRRHPHSPKALTAHVALGEIELTKLHRASKALSHFNLYIKNGSQMLLPEALYGKARALRSLGNTEKEKQALKGLLQHFPKSLQAFKARQRLDQIQAKKRNQ